MGGPDPNAIVTPMSVVAMESMPSNGMVAMKIALFDSDGNPLKPASKQETVTTANSGATYTIADPVSGASIIRLTLTASCTLTFPAPAAGKSFTLALVQGGSGSYTVTWPGAVDWAGAVAPTLSTAVGKVDYLTFVCSDDVSWAGFVSGLDMR